MQQDNQDADLPDTDLSDLTAQLLQAIASEPVSAAISRLARDLQAALDRRAANRSPQQDGAQDRPTPGGD